MEQEIKNVRLSVEPNPQGPIRYFIYLVLFSLFIFLGVSAKNALKSGGQDTMNRNTITVSGEAKRFAKPDVAIASFTVRKENASLKTAQDEVSTLTNRVVGYLKQEGVAEKDIKSTAFNIYPQEKYESYPCIYTPGADYKCPPRPTVKTYVVESSYEVKMRDLNKVGTLIAGASDAGANEIGSSRFVLDDPVLEGLRREAREEAIGKAREEAKKLSRSLGVHLGGLVSFNDAGGPVPIYDRYSFGKGGAIAEAVPPPAINAGESEISVNVSLVYEIK